MCGYEYNVLNAVKKPNHAGFLSNAIHRVLKPATASTITYSLYYVEPSCFFLGLEEGLDLKGVEGSWCLQDAVEGVGLLGSSAMMASGVLGQDSNTEGSGGITEVGVVREGQGFSFQRVTLALTPRR